MGRLDGKNALVTGGSRGIGRAIALQLARDGARVALSYRSGEAEAHAVANEINAIGGQTLVLRADVSKANEARELIAKVLQQWGRLDILVNNAGVYQFTPLEEVTENEFHREFNTNVLGLILATREAVKYFGVEGGSVINISSVASSVTPPASVIYTATKGAVDAVTRVLAKELGSRKIRVNSINPGAVETEGYRAIGIPGSDFEKQTAAQTPLGRIGQPRDIAPVAGFLASSDSAWITGETLRVAGGFR